MREKKEKKEKKGRKGERKKENEFDTQVNNSTHHTTPHQHITKLFKTALNNSTQQSAS